MTNTSKREIVVKMKVIFTVRNTTYISSSENKFRPVWELNPWPLWYQYSALPAELTMWAGSFFTTAQVVFITAKVPFILIFKPQFTYMVFIQSQSHVFITSQVYYEPTYWPAPSCLVSSVGRALYSITEVMSSNPMQAWIFFRPYFHYCLHASSDH